MTNSLNINEQCGEKDSRGPRRDGGGGGSSPHARPPELAFEKERVRKGEPARVGAAGRRVERKRAFTENSQGDADG